MSIDGDQIDSGCDSSFENSDDENLEEELWEEKSLEESDGESLLEEEVIPPPSEPIRTITEVVFDDSLLYGGFCFGGVSKTLDRVTELKIGDSDVLLAEIQARCLLNAANPGANLFVDLTPEFKEGLDKLMAKIAKKIGCSKAFFELLFQKMLVFETGAEVTRHKDEEMAPNQFGTLFIQPPSSHTGGEMKVYRKLVADEEEEMHLKFGANFGTSACKWQFGFVSSEAEYEIDPILSGSRLMLVFAAIWSPDQGLRFHGAEQIDQITTQLELQRANDDFLVAFLRDTYENLEGIGKRALKHADRSLVRLLKAANEHLERPFKVVLVSVAKHEWEKDDEYEELEWDNPEEFEQQWFDLEGNPWPYNPKANLEVMKNVLNPERKSLKQLWGSYVEEQLLETLDYDNLLTYRVTYRRSLLVLWPSDLTIGDMAKLEGWDIAFKTLIDKSPDSEALVSLLQLFKMKNRTIYKREELEDETIRLIYDYIDEKSLLDALPLYIDIFFESKDAIKPIIVTSNEEIWKTSWPILLSNIEQVKFLADYLKIVLDLAREEQAPKERRYKVLLEVIKNDIQNNIYLYYYESYLRLALVLADEVLMTTLCEAMIKHGRFGHYFDKILWPEFAPLMEKFWTSLHSMVERRIDFLKDAIVKGSKPFDVNFPDLEAVFPKGSDELNWLLTLGRYPHGLRFDSSERANQVMEHLKVYKSIFYTQFCESYDKENEYNVYLLKSDKFARYQFDNDSKKKELLTLEKLKNDNDQGPPTKKKKNG